jgi:hypothetical protein
MPVRIESTPRYATVDSSKSANDLDGERAVAIGRAQRVDLVFVGTVLEAKSDESNKSGWVPRIKGQSANVRLHRVKASVTLQGELYDVRTGGRIFSTWVTGSEANNVLSGTAYTRYGSWGKDDYRAFLDSPLGKAFEAALDAMTKKIVESRKTR